MNVVPDTNVVLSGMFWHGPPRRVLALARQGGITLFTTPCLLQELLAVLRRDKFAQPIRRAGLSAEELVSGFAALAVVIRPPALSPVIQDDPDDDAVLACALACKADYIISGDRHLLTLRQFRDIPILTPADFLHTFPG